MGTLQRWSELVIDELELMSLMLPGVEVQIDDELELLASLWSRLGTIPKLTRELDGLGS